MESSNYEEEFAKKTLKSSSKVLFKLSDYVSLPRKFACNFQGFLSLLLGSRRQDKDGKYLAGDHSRFLFIFHSPRAFFIVSLALTVLIAQYLTVAFIVMNSTVQFPPCDYNPENSQAAVALCVIYAAYVATQDFNEHFPFELVGKNKEDYCRIINAKVRIGVIPSSTYWLETIMKFIKIPFESKSIQETNKRAKDFYELMTCIVCFSMMLSMNALLLSALALSIAYASTTVNQLQNFVAIEIVMHIDEVIPKIFRIEDISPERYSKSWPLVLPFIHHDK